MISLAAAIVLIVGVAWLLGKMAAGVSDAQWNAKHYPTPSANDALLLSSLPLARQAEERKKARYASSLTGQGVDFKHAAKLSGYATMLEMETAIQRYGYTPGESYYCLNPKCGNIVPEGRQLCPECEKEAREL